MSWTSEFEPPPPRPNIEGDGLDDGAENGGDDGIWTDVSEPIDIPDEGPLDPSIFDGLFDDLTEQPQPVDPELDQPDLDPLRSEDPELIDSLADQPAPDPVDSAEGDSDEISGHEETAATEPIGPIEDGDTDDGDTDDGDTGDGDTGDGDTDHREIERARAGSLLDASDPRLSLFAGELTIGPQQEPPDEPTEPAGTDGVAVIGDGAVETEPQPVEEPTGPTALQLELIDVRPEPTELQLEQAEPELEPIGLRESPIGDPIVAPDQPPHYDPRSEPPPIDLEHSPDPDPDPDPDHDDRQQPLRVGRPTGRRWPAFAMAILIGAGLGIGGAVILSQVVDRSEDPESVAARSGSAAEQSGSEQAAADGSTPVDTAQLGIGDQVAAGGLELNTIRFVPGTLDLTDSSRVALAELAAAADPPEAPISVIVRTYSEPTALENQVLSRSQAQAIGDHLTGLGLMPESVRTVGLGAPPLTETQPVPNFVEVSAGLQPSALKTMVRGLNPFAIGLDPTTGRLRPESIEPLNRLGQALAADGTAGVSLAAYAHSEPDSGANRQLAADAAKAAADHLTNNFGIDPARLLILTPGQAPYIVSEKTGNHISLRWGESGTTAAAVAAIDPAAISFQPASAVLGPEAEVALTELASIVEPTGQTLVMELHTATEDNDAANTALGQRQAAAVTDHLVSAGLPQDRVRVHGPGRLRQFQGQDQTSLAIVTAID